MGREGARKQISTHMGSWCVESEDLVTEALYWVLSVDSEYAFFPGYIRCYTYKSAA